MTTIFLVFSFIFGLIIGSFINCLVWRLHKKQSIMGRSYCPRCEQKIAWYDNIPLLSFLLLRGRCRACKKSISWQYPLVELITAGLFLLAGYHLMSNFGFIETWSYQAWLEIFKDWFLLAIFTIIFIMDLRWYVVRDEVAVPAIFIVLVINLLLGFSWQGLVISATIGTGFFLIQFIFSQGKWLGGGDVRLGLLLGAALGWPNILAAIFLAYLLGAVVGLGLLLSKQKKPQSLVPLGTFLTIAGTVVLFYGQTIINWYLNFINWR